jgi:hypothetical protein
VHICYEKNEARTVRALIIALSVALELTVHSSSELGSPNKSMTTPSETPAPTSTPQISRVDPQVPEAILNSILKEAAKLANVSPQELVIVRAEAVVWNDGSLGCPEPGMEYAQALVNGYWVVIEAGGQTYDFRVGRDGNFRLCPAGRGHPPVQSDIR